MAQESDPVFAYGVSLLRTAVPTLWGGIATWLLSLGVHLPAALGSVAPSVLLVVLATLWYALWHAVEATLPPAVTRLLLGANTAPLAWRVARSLSPARNSFRAAAIASRQPSGRSPRVRRSKSCRRAAGRRSSWPPRVTTPRT